jgi:hypothetical protein
MIRFLLYALWRLGECFYSVFPARGQAIQNGLQVAVNKPEILVRILVCQLEIEQLVIGREVQQLVAKALKSWNDIGIVAGCSDGHAWIPGA